MRNKIMVDGIFILFVTLLVLFVPYFFIEWSPYFPIEPVLGLWEHFGVMMFFCILCVSAFCFLWYMRIGFGLNSNYSKAKVNNKSLMLIFLWFILGLSIVSHVILVALALKGYLVGGFIGAREETLGVGIGVPMRFHLIALPMLSVLYGGMRYLGGSVRFLLILMIARVFLMSERSAMLELIASVWFSHRLSGGVIPWGLIVKLVPLIAIIFSVVQGIRISYQSDIDTRIHEIGGVSVFDTLVAYYSDTLNKAYVQIVSDYSYPFKAYMESIDRYKSGVYGQFEDTEVKFGGLFDGRWFTSGLNNPGGLAQDWSDFGLLFGTVVAVIKLVGMSYVIFISATRIFFVPFVGFFSICIFEYPRLNFIYQPQFIVLFIIALLVGILSTKSAGG